MRINSISANQSSFKTIYFSPNFNIILADRTESSGEKDSRNGLGKSTLIEIIHFCLGSSTSKGKGLMKEALKKWVFSLSLTLFYKTIVIARSIERPSRVIIQGDTSDWLIQPRIESEENILSIDDLKKNLGFSLFGLTLDEDRQFKPTFRGLIPYFIRRGPDAYASPFEHFRKQLEWDIQVSNSFLLGLSWENASDLQIIKDQSNFLDNLKKLKKTVKTGIVVGILGSLGELESAKIQIEQQLLQKNIDLKNFHIYPQYNELQEEANNLTLNIHEITNKNILDRHLIAFYENSLKAENEPPRNDVISLYENAGVQLPNTVKRRLEEVEAFHIQVIKNRKKFLSSEINRLKKAINERDRQIKVVATQRASCLQILETHGALEEYTKLQEHYLQAQSQLNEINQRIEELRRVEEGKSSLRIEKELLISQTRRDYEEHHTQAQKAIALFNTNSQALYDAPGTLVIDIGQSGFRFKVDIARDGSGGIEKMKIFCYDLMLAQLWSESESSPGILIHDSILFDGVDERQVALALELAAKESEKLGFQYICTFNSDLIPLLDLSPNFDFNSYVRERLTDDEGGNLFGINF
jgi:uncharacterized protein YydD (DUF2326 family)